MMEQNTQRYLVARLDELDYRPLPEAVFEIQILNSCGQAIRCAYLGSDSYAVIALVEFPASGPPVRLDVADHCIPEAVIKAARSRSVGRGERVNDKGEILPAF